MDMDVPPDGEEGARGNAGVKTTARTKDDLSARIQKAREAAHPQAKAPAITGSLSGIGAAMRIGSELLAALIVGVGAGYFLDVWLGTRPWMMVVFFFLGSAAGILNVYRAASSFASADEGQPENDRKDGP